MFIFSLPADGLDAPGQDAGVRGQIASGLAAARQMRGAFVRAAHTILMAHGAHSTNPVSTFPHIVPLLIMNSLVIVIELLFG